MKNYDITIIGGGISGIYTMYKLKKNNPNLNVILLEKNERLGGRVYTFKDTINGIKYNMDLGAGRIGYHHKNMIELINTLQMERDIIPISNTENYIEYDSKKNTSQDKSRLKLIYSTIINKFFNSYKIKRLSKLFLQSTYLNNVFHKFFNKKDYTNIVNQFEYKNKLYHLNSYDAIKYFKDDYNSTSKFFIMKNGFSSIIDKMVGIINNNKKQNKKYKIKNNSFVQNIQYNKEINKYIINYTTNISEKTINSNIVILALPREDLIKFNILNCYRDDLDTINEISKVRIFEIYDTKQEVWFKDIKKTVTNQELQFIIPINPDTGMIMSSYNENIKQDKNFWNELYKKGKNNLKFVLNEQLNKIFSCYNIQVPMSKYIKFYYWPMGVACWKKNVDSELQHKKIENLMPNLYICGENYSTYQAWCEGALISSNNILNRLEKNYYLKSRIFTRKIRKNK